MLASAGDDGNTLLWVPSETQVHASAFGEDGLEDKETWRIKHMCRSSGSEIYDLAWSPDGVFFITGSMDNVARIYNAQTGTQTCTLPLASSTMLTSTRTNGEADSRTQSLRSRCGMGSPERICSNAVIRSLRTHLQSEDQGRSIHSQPTQQDH